MRTNFQPQREKLLPPQTHQSRHIRNGSGSRAHARCARGCRHHVVLFKEGHASNAMSHVGSAVDTMLLVPASIADRAREILVGHESADSQATEWFCGACGETNEATFDVCWSCGAERETASAPFPDSSENFKGCRTDRKRQSTRSRRIPSGHRARKKDLPTKHRKQLDQIDVKLTRAMRCGFIGLGFLSGHSAALRTLFAQTGLRPWHPF